MTRKIYWGIAILIVLLLGVTAVLLTRTTDTEPNPVYRGDREPLNPNPTLNTIEPAEKEQAVTPQPTEKAPAPKDIVPAQAQNETESSAGTAGTVETVETGDVPVSAFGFGPFPEVPEGMVDVAGNPFEPEWREGDYPDYKFSREFELIDRVKIKKWKEGDRDVVGASFQYNKVYLNYPNTVYVWYTDEDGEETSLDTSGPVSISIEQIQSGNIPPGIRVIDGETGGIDPFEYLGLNR